MIEFTPNAPWMIVKKRSDLNGLKMIEIPDGSVLPFHVVEVLKVYPIMEDRTNPDPKVRACRHKVGDLLVCHGDKILHMDIAGQEFTVLSDNAVQGTVEIKSEIVLV